MKIEKVIVNEVNNNAPVLITQGLLDKIKIGDKLLVGEEDPAAYNEEGDSYFQFMIFRMVEETKEEIKKREDKFTARQIRDKVNRHETYIRLKKEFEDE